MLEVIAGVPENVVAISAKGKVTGRDYESVLIPAVEKALTQHEKIRFLYRIGSEFAGFTAAALWDDAVVGLRNRKAFERVAIVTDSHWVADAVKVLGFLVSCPVRVFGDHEFDDATAWVAA